MSNVLTNSFFSGGGVTLSDLDKYLPLTGGTLSGDLGIVTSIQFDRSSGVYGKGAVFKNNTAGDNAIMIQDIASDGSKAVLHVNALNQNLSLQLYPSDGTSTTSEIYGDHNLTYALKKMFPSTATPTYIPVFGSNWESRGYITPANLMSGVSGRKVQVKTYTGTGTYGSSNPCSLTFSFAPTIAIMLASYNGSSAMDVPSNGTNGENVMVSALTTSYKSGMGFDWGNTTTESYGKKSSDGKTFYWYNAKNAAEQCNSEGYTYYVLALG